ncbi:MAG: CHAT domain-containing protein [Bacteroidota bacterium]
MKLQYFFLSWLLILIFSISANGQKAQYRQLSDSVYAIWPAEDRTANYDSLIDNKTQSEGEEAAAMLSHEISMTYYSAKDKPSALRFGQKEVAFYEKIQLFNPTYAQALYQCGFILEQMRMYDSAMTYYKIIIEDNIDPSRTARTYGRMGECFKLTGDREKSINFYKKCINQLDKLKQTKSAISNRLNLANVYQEIRNESYKEEYLNLINKLISAKNDPANADFFEGKRNILYHFIVGNFYNADENTSGFYEFQNANYHYQKAVETSEKQRYYKYLSPIYANFGNLYHKEKKDSALFFLEKSLAYPHAKFREIKIYRNLYDYYYDRDQLPKALESINRSLAANLSVSEDSVDIAGYHFYDNCINQDEVLAAIVKKVHVLIKIGEADQSDDHLLNLATKLIDIGDELLTSIKNQSSTEGSKLYWRVRATDIYSKGFLLASRFNDNEKAFYFSEKIKSLLLIENILTEANKKDLPDEIKSKELTLKNTILKKERQLRNITDEEKRKILREQIVNDQVAYQTFLDSLQDRYPEFYAVKNKSVSITDLAFLQSQLSDTSAVISYVWDIDDDNYDYLYFLLVTKSHCKLLVVKEVTTIGKLIDDFNQAVAKPFETQQETEKFRSIANELYLKLFPSEEIRNIIKGKKLLILPDHNIHGIPFEALVADQKTGRYLIEENEISYAYSISFLFHNENIKRTPSEQMISFSPVIFQYDELAPLKQSAQEVSEINQIIDGKSLMNQTSTKEAFFNESGDFKIIHLATHAQAGENPWVAFSDAKMDITELHTFQNQAELVVLSACDTSLGEIAEGEGILSLARSFFYSGANSIIATLWNVNDKSTSFVFKEFYKNLKSGDSKSAALRKAKLHYLKNNSLSDASPYYWASFTLLGSDKPITLKSPQSNLKWWIIGPLLIGIIFLAFYSKKRQKQR